MKKGQKMSSTRRSAQGHRVVEGAFDEAAFLARVAKLHASMPMTQPVVEKMRRATKY